MLCPRCNNAVDPGAVFCGNCGLHLTPSEVQPGQVALPPTNQQAPQVPQPDQQPMVVPQQATMPPAPQSFQPNPVVSPQPQQVSPQPMPMSQPSQPVQPVYPGSLPAQPMQPNYGYAQQPPVDHSGKAIAAFVLGVLGLPGVLIPIVGIILGILAIIFGTMSLHSKRKILAIIGMSLAVLVILTSLFFWVRATQEYLKDHKNGTTASSSADPASLQSIETPCYTTKIPKGMKVTQTAGSCTFLGSDVANGEQEEVKVLQVPGLTSSNLPNAAKQDSANVVGSIPGGSISKQQASTFADSQSYEIEIKATDGSAGLISYVYDTTSQGDLVIVLHTQARASNNYDLSSIESNWSWL